MMNFKRKDTKRMLKDWKLDNLPKHHYDELINNLIDELPSRKRKEVERLV